MSAGLIAVQSGSALLFFYLWVAMGWRDVSEKKILNHSLRYAGWGIASGYLLLLAMTLMGILNWVSVFPYWGFYRDALASVFLCGSASLALWWFGVWPAGDAKLFILLSILYPLTNLIAGNDYRRLFLVALINIFIPASLAVFLRAGHYVFTTRLVHRRHFLIQLGWKKELHLLFDSLREGLGRLGAWRAKAAELIRSTAADPRPLLSRIGLLLVQMLVLSFFSYYLKDFFSSPILFTLFWGAVFISWSRLSTVIGANYCRAVLAVLGGGLLLFRPPADWAEFGRIFLSLSVFNFFFSMGVSWTLTVLSGSAGLAYVLMFLLPLLGVAAAAALRLGRVAGAGIAGGAGASRSRLLSLLGGVSPAHLHVFLVLAGMGAFFGLSLVLVRLWDREVLPSALDEVSSYVVLAPGFIERLRQDPEFFEEHFSRLYPDGLTGAQAKAVQEWCARKGVEMIPLTPTISFAAWIFFGFFLTRIMKGTHVMELFF